MRDGGRWTFEDTQETVSSLVGGKGGLSYRRCGFFRRSDGFLRVVGDGLDQGRELQ